MPHLRSVAVCSLVNCQIHVKESFGLLKREVTPVRFLWNVLTFVLFTDLHWFGIFVSVFGLFCFISCCKGIWALSSYSPVSQYSTLALDSRHAAYRGLGEFSLHPQSSPPSRGPTDRPKQLGHGCKWQVTLTDRAGSTGILGSRLFRQSSEVSLVLSWRVTSLYLPYPSCSIPGFLRAGALGFITMFCGGLVNGRLSKYVLYHA